MNKKQFAFLQHNLIPLALIIGNFAVVHLIFGLMAKKDLFTLLTITLSILLLAAGIFRPNKYLLILGMLLYSLVFTLSF